MADDPVRLCGPIEVRVEFGGITCRNTSTSPQLVTLKDGPDTPEAQHAGLRRTFRNVLAPGEKLFVNMSAEAAVEHTTDTSSMEGNAYFIGGKGS